MGYSLGDYVVHQSFGVGTVITIETMSASNEPCLYYRVGFDKTTIWVPVLEHPNLGVRPLTPKGDLDQYRSLLKSPPEPLLGDFRARQAELVKRLDHGSYSGLCKVVRDLSAHLAIRALTQYEKNLLKRTSDALVSEWSLVSGLSQTGARSEIDGYLGSDGGF
jgi:RNA polymerase-interacting CarD/CdnL/TRCF family regulator